ncbi:MAG TPA: hypothetical protein VHG91_07920, partial [Longimicrobium sp.]|nr:hypothetical protein [Longimicrobium sp.]
DGAVGWTQGGPVDGVRFEVQRRLETEDDAAFAPAATVAAGTPPGADGRYRVVDGGRVPGLRYVYRVVAVREAPDPADPTGAARRDIASAPSAARVAVAISSVPLAAPGDFAAAWDGAAGEVALAWTNPEAYTSLQLWRRSAEGHGYLLVGTAAGDATAFRDATAAIGTWSYQLRARGVSREARTPDAEVTVP